MSVDLTISKIRVYINGSKVIDQAPPGYCYAGYANSQNDKYITVLEFATGSDALDSITLSSSYLTASGSGNMYAMKVSTTDTAYIDIDYNESPGTNGCSFSVNSGEIGATVYYHFNANQAYYLAIYGYTSAALSEFLSFNVNNGSAGKITGEIAVTKPYISSVSPASVTAGGSSWIIARIQNPDLLSGTVKQYVNNTLVNSVPLSATASATSSYYPQKQHFQYCTNSTSATVKFEIVYDGSVCSTATATMNASSDMAPSIDTGDFTVTPVVSSGSIQAYIAGKSEAQIDITTANITTYYGATINTVSVKYDGVTLSPVSGSSTQFKTGIFQSSGNHTLQIIATDSRGMTGSYNYIISVYAYVNPYISGATVKRGKMVDGQWVDDDEGTGVSILATGVCSSITDGTNTNTVTITAYASRNSGAYTRLGTVTSGSTTIFQGVLDQNSIYKVKLTVTDLCAGSQDYIYELTFQQWMFCCLSDGDGAAIGMPASNSNALEIPDDWALKSGAAKFGNEILKLVSGAHYGTSAPSGTGENGEVYFQLSSSSSGWISATPYIYISSS